MLLSSSGLQSVHRTKSGLKSRTTIWIGGYDETEVRVRAMGGAQSRRLATNERREFEGLETAIFAAEGEVVSLEAVLHDPEVQVKRFAEIPALAAELEAAKAEVARLYARWEALETLS